MSAVLIVSLVWPQFGLGLLLISILASLPVFWSSLQTLRHGTITINTFNAFALGVSFFLQEYYSAAFIVLMLSFAALLEWRTKTRSRSAVQALLALQPQTAQRKQGKEVEAVPVSEIRVGNEIVVPSGARVPVDGALLSKTATLNEASLTGESIPVTKLTGATVLGGSLNESEPFMIRATRIGKDSTLAQMAELMEQAAKNKSRSERTADRFARIFLPVVIILAVLIYVISRDVSKVAAVFLVACADDMAVAIPLAIQAALGQAAKRGVIFKGGEFLDALTRVEAVVLDKTGTLTYGNFAFQRAEIQPGVDPKMFWRMAGLTEKYSEHPIGRAIFQEALRQVSHVPDPDETKVLKGSGIWARFGKDEVALGDVSLFSDLHLSLSETVRQRWVQFSESSSGTAVVVVVNGKFSGFIAVADEVRSEARESIVALQKLDIHDIRMFTGDGEKVARRIAMALGIEQIQAAMLPQDKVREISAIAAEKSVAMVGDGVNDAPALARANVSVAMGAGGAAIAVEAADIVVLQDNLARIPEMIAFSRRVRGVIRLDTVIWLVSNVVGISLVFTGIFGPALAAFYNFATDFLPLLNSARLFRKSSKLV